jgi:Uncharacterized protein conserved in bacteria
MRRAVAIALAIVGLTAPVRAQDYPSRPVTIVVPYPAGGPTDQVARQVASALSTKFGQNFIVENVSGGGTIIATTKSYRRRPTATHCFCITCRYPQMSRFIKSFRLIRRKI